MIVVKQKCLNPPKNENKRERQEIEFDWKESFLTLKGNIINAQVFCRKTCGLLFQVIMFKATLRGC